MEGGEGGKVKTISEGLEKGMGEEEWGGLWGGKGEVWGEVAGVFDELWFVDCSIEEIVRRFPSFILHILSISLVCLLNISLLNFSLFSKGYVHDI